MPGLSTPGPKLTAGHTDDAIETFRASLADRPNNAYALYGLAEALKQKELCWELGDGVIRRRSVLACR